MHVVGEDRAAIGGQRAGDREIVAARRACGFGYRGCRRRFRQPAQVQDLRARQHRIATRRALQRRIPAAAVVREQVEQRSGQVRAHPPQRQFARVVATLQVEVHRMPHQRGILDAPRRRLLAQQQVGPRPHTQTAEASVDSVCIGLQLAALGAGNHVHVALDARTHAMQPMLPVGVHRDVAEQRGQLAGSGAAQQVHLEVALLRMYVTERAQGIVLVGGIDGDRAVGVARDRHRRRQPGQVERPVQGRQAAAQQPGGEQRERHDQCQQGQCAAPEPFGHRVPRGGGQWPDRIRYRRKRRLSAGGSWCRIGS